VELFSECSIDYFLYKELVDAYRSNITRHGRKSKLNENIKEIDDELKYIKKLLHTASDIHIDMSLGLSVLSVSVATKQKILGEFAGGCVKLRRKLSNPEFIRSLLRQINQQQAITSNIHRKLEDMMYFESLNGSELTWEIALDALEEQENSGVRIPFDFNILKEIGVILAESPATVVSELMAFLDITTDNHLHAFLDIVLEKFPVSACVQERRRIYINQHP